MCKEGVAVASHGAKGGSSEVGGQKRWGTMQQGPGGQAGWEPRYSATVANMMLGARQRLPQLRKTVSLVKSNRSKRLPCKDTVSKGSVFCMTFIFLTTLLVVRDSDCCCGGAPLACTL